MASSSSMASPASAPYPRYDVFLNHRGPDVKATFAKDLYHRLTCSGLQVFLDDPEMKAGCDIFPQIEAAIGVASVHVAIFSPRYAESKWCLEELVLMVTSMESRAAVILPVFYNVNPSELQYAGRYTEALRIHEEKKRYDLQTIQKWRDALRRVAKISGFDLDAFKGNKEELLEKVVQTVLERVPKPLLDVAKFPTGLQEKMQELQTTVLSHEEGRSEAKVVGIVGAGGIGKTTLAKEYFNSRRSEYGASSFLFDVREKAARKSLHSLQINLVKDLKGVTIPIERWDEGIGQLKKNLSACQVLVILDDVDHLDQLDAFLPIKDVVHPRSLILFTSRDKGLLIRAGIAKSSIYHLRGLNSIHSRQLFCSHAFSQLDSPPKYENLVDGFLKACDGLPLSLKVIGSRLYGEEDQCLWQEVLDGLSQTLPADIEAKLRISYDSLSEKEQQIFLDIACFAIGEDMDKWIKIWNGSGWQGLSGFRNLQYKCLVEVNMPPLEKCLSYPFGYLVHSFDFSSDIFCEDKEIRMHDHLRDLGRHIADTEVHSHRVWNSGERLRDLLEESPSVNPEVRGICSNELLSLNEEQVSRIRKLQLMDTQGCYVERIFPSVRSPKLIWLRWKKCPFYSLPSWIPMRDLRVLEVSSDNLKRLWEEQQVPLQLEELTIESKLSELPKSIGQLKRLQKFVLSPPFSYFPGDIAALPEEFYDLCSLKYLIVKNCRSFTCFGDLGKLTNLQHINLEGCENFNYLPNSLGNLSNLRYLSLHHCKRLNYLPDSLGNLSNLEYLDLMMCESLLNLTDSLGNLSNLQFLRLYSCKKLKMLPDSLWNLRNLRCLHIEICPKLETLPGSSKMLSTNIQEINLRGCTSLKMLPDSLGSLTNLRRICLSWCDSLGMLPDSFGNLTNLLDIRLDKCKSLKRIPNSLTNVNLQLIHLDDCTSLEMLPDSFGNLRSLQRIYLNQCTCLEMLPDSFGNLTSLQEISLSGCTRLKMLPDSFGNLTSLQNISLNGCTCLEMLPDSFGNLTSLQVIDLSGCKCLEMLRESFGNLTSLQKIDLRRCTRLEMLPESFGNLTSLQNICLDGCTCLEMLPDSFGNLTSLQEIFLRGCTRLEMLPESFGNLTSLQKIRLNRCTCLEMLPDSFGNLTSLQEIFLSGCTRLKMLPDSFGNLTSLQYIYLIGCACLEMLPDSFGNLTSLQVICLNECTCLEMLRESFGNLTSLRNIDLRRCTRLEMLPESFGNLTSLQNICLNGCTCLEMLPDSFGNLTSLQEIYMSGCKNLKMLPTSFWNLSQLKHLHLCSSMTISSETLANIISLEWLDGEDYCLRKDSSLPQVVCQPCLERMTLLGTNLKELPSDIAGLSNLELLKLRRPSLEVVPPSFGYLKSLKELCLYGCQKLQCLPDSIGLLTQLTELTIGECGIQYLPPAVMKLNNLKHLRIWRCPLRELPFKKADEGGEGDTALLPESSRGKGVKLNELDSSSAEKGMMVKLQTLWLLKTEIREISFPEGVCPNLRDLRISCCSDLVQVGALPVTLVKMELISCNALRKIGGLDGLVELHRLRIKGCPIEVDELLLPAQILKYQELVTFGDNSEVKLVTFGDISEEERDAEQVERRAAENISRSIPSRCPVKLPLPAQNISRSIPRGFPRGIRVNLPLP